MNDIDLNHRIIQIVSNAPLMTIVTQRHNRGVGRACPTGKHKNRHFVPGNLHCLSKSSPPIFFVHHKTSSLLPPLPYLFSEISTPCRPRRPPPPRRRAAPTSPRIIIVITLYLLPFKIASGCFEWLKEITS